MGKKQGRRISNGYMDVHKDDKRRRESGVRKMVTVRSMRKVVAISVLSPAGIIGRPILSPALCSVSWSL